MRRVARGQAMLEVVLVMPILLVLVLGCVDVGRVLMTSVVLEEATQEGALYAAYNPAPEEPIRTRVRNSTTVGELASASVSVACVASPSPGSVVVTTTIDYPLITPVIATLLGSSVTLSSSVTATNVRGTCS